MFTMLAASKMNGGRDRLHELSGIPPLSFTAKGKPLTAWSINGTPTPENPVEVQVVGEKTSNLFDYSTITTGYRIVWTTGDLYKDDTGIISDFIEVTEGQKYQISKSTKSLSVYIIGYDQNKKYLGVYDSYKGFIKSATNRYYVLKIPQESGCQYIRLMTFISDHIDATVMFTCGETVPNEFIPYGYKIPVVTRGKNLFDYNLMFQNSVVYNDYFNVYNLILKPYTEYEISTNGEEKIFTNPHLQNKETQFIVCNTSELFSTVNGGVSYKKKLFKTTGADGVLIVGYRTKCSPEGANIVNKADMDAGILWLNIIQTPITTPIYLPTPLYSGEVMRSDGTITRSDGTTETFTAPQIPTLNGTTVIDVDTAVKPTEMYTKYKSSK